MIFQSRLLNRCRWPGAAFAIILATSVLTLADEILEKKDAPKSVRQEVLATGQWKGEPFTGEILFFHPNGEVERRYRLNNGERHGEQWTFYSDGAKRYLASFRDNILHGPVRSWAVDGLLLSEAFWSEGSKSGIWKKWDPFGQLYWQAEYEEGERVDNNMAAEALEAWRLNFEKSFPSFINSWREASRPWPAEVRQNLHPAEFAALRITERWLEIDETADLPLGGGRARFRLAPVRLSYYVVPELDPNTPGYAQLPDGVESNQFEKLNPMLLRMPSDNYLYLLNRFRNACQRWGKASAQSGKGDVSEVAGRLGALVPVQVHESGFVRFLLNRPELLLLDEEQEQAMLLVRIAGKGKELVSLWFERSAADEWQLIRGALPEYAAVWVSLEQVEGDLYDQLRRTVREHQQKELLKSLE